MKTIQTLFAAFRNVAALAVAVVLVYFINSWASFQSVQMDGLLALIFFLVFGAFVPSFLAVLIPLGLPSWRDKLSVGTFTLFGVTIFFLLRMFLVVPGWMTFLFSVILLSGAMAGALLALYLWRKWRLQFIEKHPQLRSTRGDSRKLPKFQLGLSLLSIPLTYFTLIAGSLMVLGLSALLLLLLFMLPRIPVFLLAAGFLAPLAALWATIQALAAMLSRKPQNQQAVLLESERHPALFRLIGDVCRELKTRLPDNIILLAEPNFFVTTASLQCYDIKVKGRTLGLGMPLLKEVTPEELKGILAHEFAHFTGNDTLYSRLVAPVYRGLGTSMQKLQQSVGRGGGSAGAVIQLLSLPTLVFLRLFYEFFASLTMGLSRSRELRADWLAASHYGSDRLISGLKKTNQIVPHFYQFVQNVKIEEQEKMDLFQQHSQLLKEHGQQLSGFLEKALQEEDSEFSSHPTLKMRIAQLEALQAKPAGQELERDFGLQEDEARLSFFYSKTIVQTQALIRRLQQAQKGKR